MKKYIIAFLYVLDFARYHDSQDDQQIVISRIKELHGLQTNTLFSRLRQESDWKSLQETWKMASKEDPRSKYMYFLETKDSNTSNILAYAVFHFQEGDRYAKVLYFNLFSNFYGPVMYLEVSLYFQNYD